MANRAAALSDEIQDNLEDLIESVEALLEDLKEHKGAAADKLRTRAWATVKSARRRMANVSPHVGEIAAKTLRGTASGLRTTADFVRQDPWRAVAIGALAVVALGAIARASRWRAY
jgi:ElaB/YqjD/DUF883 family membrane-anchored ribosome-binding protein